MSLTINLTPSEETLLSAAAERKGLTPHAYAEQLVREHLPVASPAEEADRRSTSSGL